jgi:exo-1,4-beta-D-glucosaminidase
VTSTLTNRSKTPAFFIRAEVTRAATGDEILPILWDDNYVTLFAGETKKLQARYAVTDAPGSGTFVRLQGHNVPVQVLPVGAQTNALLH